jgi:hypothetical protein
MIWEPALLQRERPISYIYGYTRYIYKCLYHIRYDIYIYGLLYMSNTAVTGNPEPPRDFFPFESQNLGYGDAIHSRTETTAWVSFPSLHLRSNSKNHSGSVLPNSGSAGSPDLPHAFEGSRRCALDKIFPEYSPESVHSCALMHGHQGFNPNPNSFTQFLAVFIAAVHT